MEIEKTYDSKSIEKKWYTFWQESGYFQPNDDSSKAPFTVVIPPPNVTGILHMGHVLNNTLQDIAVRYQRMTGRPTLWIPGTDHAGIATQNVVEKELAKQGITRHIIGRDELVKRIWEYKDQKGSHILEQLKQLGCSCDWSRLRFTMDEGLSLAVKKVFVTLYNEGLIYKGNFIINWCPRCTTALSNDEVEYEDHESKLWYIRYPLASGEGHMTVATTRPETMFGDTAVAVNPKDERYQHLIGNSVILPLCNRHIPIIADDYVDFEFGTGCVKITPAHDPNDFEVGNRHHLEKLVIMDTHAVLNDTVPPEYAGLDRYTARKKVLATLQEENLLEKTENHTHSVGHCYRCDTMIEPYLSDQWFVKMKPLSHRAIEVVESGAVKLYPERWTKVYMHWMTNIRDWCISRQIWWGHRIPAFYCDACGEMIVNTEKPALCSKCGGVSFTQDPDVLDTWFSSWLWPFSTMGWPEDTPDLSRFLPTNLLITAPEIIYLWVARMIMATLKFKDTIPFDTVLLHGIVRDSQGRKMSKSLGNSPDPIEIIEQVGADALRFSIVFSTPKGQDSYYSDQILETGRNFANKIWNAFRFIIMNIENIDGLPFEWDNVKRSAILDLADKWIYSRLNKVISEVTEQYQNIRFNDAAQTLMLFIWDEFCSWYVEMAKEKLHSTTHNKALQTIKYILLDVMQTSMRLLHPIMPFISEEIWQYIKQYLPMPEAALIIASFPTAQLDLINPQIDADMSLIKETISGIRNLRKQMNISPAVMVDIAMKITKPTDQTLFEDYKGYVCKLAKVANLTVGIDTQKPPSSLVGVVADIQIYLPLSDLIDVQAEIEKLTNKKEKLVAELETIQRKLNNAEFVSRAKPEVVEKEKQKENEIMAKLNTVIEVLRELVGN